MKYLILYALSVKEYTNIPISIDTGGGVAFKIKIERKIDMEVKKSNKGLVITIVILIILLLGAAGYICYDKFLIKEEQTTPKTEETKEELVPQNEFKLEDIKCKGTDTCEKIIKLAYNGKNHELKLIKKYDSSNKKYLIEVYEDNALIDTVNAGSYDDSEGKIVYEDKNGNKKVLTPSEVVKKMAGRVYVIDSKYLGIVYRHDIVNRNSIDNPMWYLKFYNGNKPYKKSMLVAAPSIGIAESDGKWNNLHTLEALEFDGTNVKYWGYYCKNGKLITQDEQKDSYDTPPYFYAAQYSAKFDGEKVNISIVQILDKVVGMGAEAGCNEVWDKTD